MYDFNSSLYVVRMISVDVSCVADNELIKFLMNMTLVLMFWNEWLTDLCCGFTLFCRYIVVGSWNTIKNIIRGLIWICEQLWRCLQTKKAGK